MHDGFTILDDSLLVTIVSFLPFKEAARTCVLSKRWTHIWRCMTNVEFSESFFTSPNLLTNDQDSTRQVFCNFARKWILSCEQRKVYHFRLSLYSVPDIDPDFLLNLQEWIQFFINKEVEELDIDLSNATVPRLPNCVYEHRLLKSLKLSGCEFTPLSLQRLTSNCKLLETLSLKKCVNLYSDITIDVGMSRLKSLILENCTPRSNIITITIVSPTLRSFKYIGCMNQFVLENLNSLEDVDLDFGLEEEFDYSYGDYLVEMLQQLNAKVLRVCTYVTQVLSSAEDSRVLLDDVQHLTIRIGRQPSEFEGILFMLKSCENLKKLSFEMEDGVKVLDGIFDHKAFWRYVPQMEYPFLRSIVEVEVMGYKGTSPNEFELLRCMLKGCSVLELMVINFCKDDYPGLYQRNAERFLRVKKASANAVVLIQ